MHHEIEIHPQDVLEQNLSIEERSTNDDLSAMSSTEGFAGFSPSGFAGFSASGFAGFSASGFAGFSASGFAGF